MIALVLVALVVFLLFGGVPGWRGPTYRDAKIAVRQDANVVQQALDSYWMRHRAFPADDEGLAVLGGVNLDDPWGNPYVYESYYGGQGCSVISLGADGARGGRGIDADVGMYSRVKYSVR